MLHPFDALYVIVLVPALTPVTNPVAEIVATPVFELLHVPGVTAFANWDVNPKHAVNVPVICCNGFTVTVPVPVTAGQPATVYVAV